MWWDKESFTRRMRNTLCKHYQLKGKGKWPFRSVVFQVTVIHRSIIQFSIVLLFFLFSFFSSRWLWSTDYVRRLLYLFLCISVVPSALSFSIDASWKRKVSLNDWKCLLHWGQSPSVFMKCKVCVYILKPREVLGVWECPLISSWLLDHEIWWILAALHMWIWVV